MFDDFDRFKLFLDSTFQLIQRKNIENLIIDIRENGGGNSKFGNELFQYISPVPFAQFGKAVVRISDIQRTFYKVSYNIDVTNLNGIINHNENNELIKLRKNKFRFKGNVYLLISHYTFSSAASLAWAFKYFKMGTVVGEESGGLAVCFGDVIGQKLPNTGLFYNSSHKKFYQYGAKDENIHGTIPDYEVEKENALDFTIKLIDKKK